MSYALGTGVEKNQAKAFKLYWQAADQGHADAQCSLGACYAQGEGVPQDMAQAAWLYKQAAKQGHALAQHSLGVFCEKGEGVLPDEAQAARLFWQAADQGLTKAQCSLGVCYEHGKGVPYDMREAVALYRLAIAGGCVAANANLGLCFEKGRGVPLDRAEAERLYQLAAESGSGSALACAFVGTLNDEIVAPRRIAHAAALVRTRNAVYGLNLAARLGDSAAAEHLASLARRRDVVSACCVGCGAVRKLMTCSKCRVARFCDMDCVARMWPAHMASCKAWRKE
jgi:TPR repeat protein